MRKTVMGLGGGVYPSEKVCGCRMIISMKINAIEGGSEGPQRWVLSEIQLIRIFRLDY